MESSLRGWSTRDVPEGETYFVCSNQNAVKKLISEILRVVKKCSVLYIFVIWLLSGNPTSSKNYKLQRAICVPISLNACYAENVYLSGNICNWKNVLKKKIRGLINTFISSWVGGRSDPIKFKWLFKDGWRSLLPCLPTYFPFLEPVLFFPSADELFSSGMLIVLSAEMYFFLYHGSSSSIITGNLMYVCAGCTYEVVVVVVVV